MKMVLVMMVVMVVVSFVCRRLFYSTCTTADVQVILVLMNNGLF